jgi:integrase
VPLPVLQELMGHASLETNRRYVHVIEAQKRDAISRVLGGRGSHVAAGKAKPRKW